MVSSIAVTAAPPSAPSRSSYYSFNFFRHAVIDLATPATARPWPPF
ncbi:hypothetical protein [Chromobacterium sp. ATCC 53434]|nr:hypothetical protein [Chromobacterium sp. ATCC 53434]